MSRDKITILNGMLADAKNMSAEEIHEILQRLAREVEATGRVVPVGTERDRILVSVASIRESARCVSLMLEWRHPSPYDALSWRERRTLKKQGITEDVWVKEFYDKLRLKGIRAIEKALEEA